MEHWYIWYKEYRTKRPPDPKYRCAFVTKKGKRCTRMTTTIYCNQHVKVIEAMLKGKP